MQLKASFRLDSSVRLTSSLNKVFAFREQNEEASSP